MNKQCGIRPIFVATILLGALTAHQILANDAAGSGGFDPKAFQASLDNVTKEVIDYVVTLGVSERGGVDGRIEAFSFLGGVSGQFVKDENGVFNEKANKEAFTAAVLNVTPAMLEKAKPFTDETGVKRARALVLALLAASDSFVQHPGQFNKSAFNAAFENVTLEKAKRAAELMNTRREVALSYLLTVSGRFLDKSGGFNAALFNARFDGLKPPQFTGTEDEREKTFLKLMKP